MITGSRAASEICAIVGVIDPDANTAGALLTAAIDMAKYESVVGVVMAGDFGTNGTLDAKFTQATTSSGVYKDIAGAATTQLTDAGTDSNKQAIISLRREQLDLANGYRFVKLNLTTAIATGDSAAIVLGFDFAHGLATDNDLTAVDEIVTV